MVYRPTEKWKGDVILALESQPSNPNDTCEYLGPWRPITGMSCTGWHVIQACWLQLYHFLSRSRRHMRN